MTIEDPLLGAHGYQLLPIATSYLVGINREMDVSDIFRGVLFIVCGGELMTIEDPSLSAHGYQLLSLATSCLVGNVMVMASLSVYSVTEPLGLTLGSQCALETV